MFLELDLLTSLSKLVRHCANCGDFCHDEFACVQFSDSEYEVRYSAHCAVEMASRVREGVCIYV